MKEASRTKRTIQNSRTSLLLFLFQILVGFYSRKVFLDYLGAEVLGVNTTLGNILSFLNLTELGIGIAMSTSLYKPIQKQDEEGICEILAVQGYLYKRIVVVLCCLSIPILIFIPSLFPTVECGNGYVYLAFFVFLSGSITSYLWNYRQVLIGADQKNFKLQPWVHGVRYLKLFLQIFCVLVVNLGVGGWILLELVANILTVFVINAVLRREYPWLRSAKLPAKDLLNKYSVLIKKTKQIFVHKIGLFVLEQTSPLIIYALVSLSMVTYYGNYMILIGYTTTLMNVVFDGMGASIGSLVAENNKKHTIDVFWELFVSRVWISAIVCFMLFLFMDIFIRFWIGESYILGRDSLMLMLIIMFIRLVRSVTDSFNHAYQLFGDVWAPIVEGIINLSLAFWLGSIWGLNGILLGVIFSLLATGLLWKPYYLFSNGLKVPTIYFYYHFVIHLAILIGSAYSSVYIIGAIDKSDTIWGEILYKSITLVSFVVFSFVLLFLLTSGMRNFTRRILGIIHVI